MGKLIIDIVTGTILDYDSCRVVDESSLSKKESRTLDEGASDSEIINIAELKGQYLP